MKYEKTIPSVACFSNALVYLKADGTVWAIGTNTNGRFGVDPAITPLFTTWTQLSIDNVKHVFAVNNQGLYVTRLDGSVWYTGFDKASALTAIYDKNAKTITWTQAPVRDVERIDVWGGQIFLFTSSGTMFYRYSIDNSRGYRTGYTTITPSLEQGFKMIAGNARHYGGRYNYNENGKHTSTDLLTYNSPILITNSGHILYRSDGGCTISPMTTNGEKRYEWTVSTVDNVKWAYIQLYKEGYIYSKQVKTRNGSHGAMILFKDGTVKSLSYFENSSSTNRNAAHGYGFNDSISHNLTTLNITNVKQIFKTEDSRTLFLKYDGTVWVCGNNSNGVLCTGNTTQQDSITQSQIDNVDYIDGYPGTYTLFLKKSGAIVLL